MSLGKMMKHVDISFKTGFLCQIFFLFVASCVMRHLGKRNFLEMCLIRYIFVRTLKYISNVIFFIYATKHKNVKLQTQYPWVSVGFESTTIRGQELKMRYLHV